MDNQSQDTSDTNINAKNNLQETRLAMKHKKHFISKVINNPVYRLILIACTISILMISFTEISIIGIIPLIVLMLADSSKREETYAYIKVPVLVIIWYFYFYFLLFPLKYILGNFISLLVYIPIVFVASTDPWKDKTNKVFLFLETFVWDNPLMIWMYFISLIGLRALEPFFSEIDNNIVVGSMPMPQDIDFLASKNIGAVVNMCREFNGYEKEYRKKNIIQFHAPTPDMCEPNLKDLVEGVQFIRQFLDNNPNMRVFIHCKGGRSRAVTMALSYYLSKKQMSVKDAFEIVAKKRIVAERGPLSYETVKKYYSMLVDASFDFSILYSKFMKSHP